MIAEIKTVGVIGAGTMGQGIAQICSLAGYHTILFDINEQALAKAQNTITSTLSTAVQKGKIPLEQEKAALDLLSFTSDILDVRADLIIEAVIEDLAVKKNLFKELSILNSSDCILASNTSSIPITRMAAGVANPERIVGVHFFNPAPQMRLVEIIAGVSTSAETIAKVTTFCSSLNKTPVQAKDSPGFIVNRVARPFYVEALKVLEEQVADVATIDKLLEATGFKMGPFRLMDLIGIDINFSVTSSLFTAFYYEPKFRPNRIQRQKVDAGQLGRKSGKGFYDYT